MALALTDSFAPHLFAIMLVNNRRAPGGKGFNLSVSFSDLLLQTSVRKLLRCIMLAWETAGALLLPSTDGRYTLGHSVRQTSQSLSPYVPRSVFA